VTWGAKHGGFNLPTAGACRIAFRAAAGVIGPSVPINAALTTDAGRGIARQKATERYWAGRPRSHNWQRLKAIDPPRESIGSVCTCEHLTGTSARYACSEEHDHECKPSPHRHTSASTSGEQAGQAARADCGSTGDRTGCARSKGAANLFTIPLDDERETASSGGLARECSVDLITEQTS